MIDKGVQLFFFKDYAFLLREDAFPPHFGGLLLANHIPACKGWDVLDLGTGTGFLAVLAAKGGAKRVVATDLLQSCVECARENVVLNNVELCVSVKKGSLFAPVKGQKFDVVFANVPIMPAPPGKRARDPMSVGRDGGPDGREILFKVIQQAPKYMRRGACIYFSHFDFVDVRETFAFMRRQGLNPRIIAKGRQHLSEVGAERVEYLRTLMKRSPIKEQNGNYFCRRYAVRGLKQ